MTAEKPKPNHRKQHHMASRKKSAATEIAQQVADKIAEQHQQLTARNWPEISATMERDENGEVKLAFATVLTNRPAEPGTVASKDSRIVTTISWSLGRKSDKIESEYPDPSQPELPGAGDEPTVE